MSKKEIMFLIAESSIHAGSGEDVGFVDQPIQRAKFTDYPVVQSSEVKGALRDYLESKGKRQEVETVFGPEVTGDFAGAVSFSEARLLFLPVKSLYGVYAYVTCPYLLNRFTKELHLDVSFSSDVFDSDAVVLEGSIVAKDSKVILHEFPFTVKQTYSIPELSVSAGKINFFKWLESKLYPDDENYKYWKENFLKRVVILSDENMKLFTQMGVEIVTRNKIGESGTANSKEGNLWTEENLPEETVMYFSFKCSTLYKLPQVNDEIQTADQATEFLINELTDKVIQLGGNKTIGRGFVLIRYAD